MRSKLADYARKLYNPGEIVYRSKGERVRLEKIVSFVNVYRQIELSQKTG